MPRTLRGMERAHGTGWHVVSSQIVIETPHLRLRRDELEKTGGEPLGSYYVRESLGFAIVFALTPDDRVVLVRQYKHGIAEEVLELPAGAIDPGETPAACAARELAEETGYVGDAPELELAGTFILDASSSTTRYFVYVARGARPLATQHFDTLEDIRVELATVDDVRRFVRDGTIAVGSSVSSIYFVLDRLGRL